MLARFIYGVRTENDVNGFLIVIRRICWFAARKALVRGTGRASRIGLNFNANTEQ
jgi:hypothetical protein